LNLGGGLAFPRREDVVNRRIVASLIAVPLLAACAHDDAGGGGGPGMSWSLTSTAEEGSKLGYGVPDSDNLVVMLTCRPKAGEVRIWITDADVANPTALVLSSGKQTLRSSVKRAEDDYDIFLATIPADDAVFTSFAATGTLVLSFNGRSTNLPGARAYAQKFADVCRR
jgi:hypothetical protein